MTYTPPSMTQNAPVDPAHRYACHNKPDSRVTVIQAQDGWTDDGRRNMIPHRTEWKDIGCGHVGYRESDPGCEGCKWRENP